MLRYFLEKLLFNLSFKILFLTCYLDPNQNPNLFQKQGPDPDLHSLKKLDPDPHKINADPKHWLLQL
jgi:hypothetical protein